MLLICDETHWDSPQARWVARLLRLCLESFSQLRTGTGSRVHDDVVVSAVAGGLSLEVSRGCAKQRMLQQTSSDIGGFVS